MWDFIPSAEGNKMSVFIQRRPINLEVKHTSHSTMVTHTCLGEVCRDPKCTVCMMGMELTGPGEN